MDSNSVSEAVAASNTNTNPNSKGNGKVIGATDPSESLSSSTTKTTSAPGTITATTNQTNHTNPTHKSTTTSSPSNKHPTILHAHRQSHNSSKLPAFRFADLKKDPIALPSLLQNHQIPPSPVSPISDPHAQTQPNTSREISPQPEPAHQSQHKINRDNNSPVSQEQLRTENLSPRSRASTFQSPRVLSTATSTSSANAKRSTSLDSTTASASAIGKINKSAPIRASVASPTDSIDTVATTRPRHRRAPLSGNSASEASSGHRMHASDDSRGASSGEEISRELAHGQRELLLPKTIQRTAADDRRNSVARRPPVSYKPPVSSNASGVTASIPPIRSFRSSGERRRSLVLDMNARSMRGYEGGEDYGDSNHRDRTLRALEGRRFDDASQITPPDSAGDRPDGDDSGDLFLKIAREDTLRRNADNNGNYGDSQSAISRVTRTSRRPLSVGVSSYQPSSPPQVVRRMSDQESSRSRGYSEDQSGERVARSLTYRGISRDKQTDEMKLKSASTTPLRNSPLTPRSMVFQDGLSSDQGSASTRRRQASVDNGTPLPSRMSSLKQGSVNYSHPRTYNSSPLVPKPTEYQKHDPQVDDANHGVEGTNSTASTAAPSTVWDELDDLKSRIHRLELTGKLPPTSGAAISRASEERPPTAHTNATTLSASPKRGSGSAVQPPDTNNMSKDGHPLLHSALTKSKQFLSVEVFEALETAANDALALSTMMGTPGQPGPISSGASSIGNGGSGATITDRQLRRKADSICRSLTELCLALSEGAAQIKPQPQQVPPTVPEDVTITSPKFTEPMTKFPGVATQRRPSAAERSLASMHSSPRALSRFEDRRMNTIVTSALPAPRYSTTVPATPTDDMVPAAGRKTAMLISRSRRAGTEEPEEGRKSSLLRTRRATTEEPEDLSDRKPLLIRARRGTINNDDDESRFRAPSRATTEVQGTRSGPREYTSQLPPPPLKESEPLASSALPRRRLGSSALNTRLVIPATSSSNIGTPQRRYFDRSTPDREMAYNIGDRIVEDRPQRQYSAMSRAGSLDKRANRGSMIATSSPATGGYR
ncbi:uncharacterized protein F4807DRAFT_373747 [Annulohypoxylon truncatum]|uniref:uncharacterized protein n=1 Tax=Annulohypoxylon truncatum TaxID=327061 RepID=UPI00200899C7|nr:uncharacterized protein F4807DRAFT_373747 [Annulohypoxylon truncatum]KAI1212499.1 hypothetical protein F4807DRAFT_373747 [Annulohypoxylon truncatum]